MLSSPWINDWWTHIYLFLLRPMLKWFLRKVTGKCELLRITYGESDKLQRTIQIENSLKFSSDVEFKRLVQDYHFDIKEATRKIMTKKDIISAVHSGFQEKLEDSLTSIRAYNKILAEVEELRQTKVSSENSDHEDCLVVLYSLWKEETMPKRIGEHWTELGFQGNDPMTDFRGMGMLGLQQLIFFAKEYPTESKEVLSLSHHPKLGFSLAIVGINLTQMAYFMLSKRQLRPHFYRLTKKEPELDDFHEVYCYLLYEFSHFWIAENPKDIMEFNRVRNKFLKEVKARLKTDDSILFASFQKTS